MTHKDTAPERISLTATNDHVNPWSNALITLDPETEDEDEVAYVREESTTGEREALDVSILTMRLSGDRQEHWVRIKCGNRKIDVRNYPGDYYNRALYERDELRHVLLGEPKPNLRDEQYADPVDTSAPPARATGEREAALREAAEIALCSFDDRGSGRDGHHSKIDWEDGYRDATRKASTAILALIDTTTPPAAPEPTAQEAALDTVTLDMMRQALTIGCVEWGVTHEHDAEGHAEHVKSSVEITASDFDQTGPQKMHGVYAKGTETVVAHTGTSPNSPTHARILTGLWNKFVADAERALAEQEKG